MGLGQEDSILLKERKQKHPTEGKYSLILGGNLDICYITYCPFLDFLKEKQQCRVEEAWLVGPNTWPLASSLPLTTCGASPESGLCGDILVPICAESFFSLCCIDFPPRQFLTKLAEVWEQRTWTGKGIDSDRVQVSKKDIQQVN